MKIIAEVGSNFSSIQDCYKSVAQAKLCGADAVKFQHFDDYDMFGFDCGHKTMLPFEWIPSIKEKADACGIEFMCTVFAPHKVKMLDEYVSTHKVASSDMCYLELLSEVRKTGKPFYLSTGGHSMQEVEYVINYLGPFAQVRLMYCESAYPANCTDFEKMVLLARFGKPLGISDHSTEIYSIPGLAKDYGVYAIEKHVDFVGIESPDKPHSLSAANFKRMVDYIRGEPREVVLKSPEEVDMTLKHNRRLIAIRDIKKGDMLELGGNFGCFRSLGVDTRGLSPFTAQQIDGNIALIDIKKGEAITPDHI